MGFYGRNFEFRTPPEERERGARYYLDNGADVPIGAPVKTATDDGVNATYTDARDMVLATGATAPVKGEMGIAVYEHIDYHGDDPVLTTYSDKDNVPNGKLFQVVSGAGIVVVFRNTEDRTFLNTRDYAGRVMVAGLGATPTVAIGDLLTPGTGDDDNGYWAETADPAEAWLRVVGVDTARGEVEAMLLF
jgi:hypothetical protein